MSPLTPPSVHILFNSSRVEDCLFITTSSLSFSHSLSLFRSNLSILSLFCRYSFLSLYMFLFFLYSLIYLSSFTPLLLILSPSLSSFFLSYVQSIGFFLLIFSLFLSLIISFYLPHSLNFIFFPSVFPSIQKNAYAVICKYALHQTNKQTSFTLQQISNDNRIELHACDILAFRSVRWLSEPVE